MREDFAIFILTHGRPNNQTTLNKLIKCGYTGKYFLVLDDQDKTIQQYIDNYGPDNIIIFDKNHYVSESDSGLSIPYFKFALFVRNAIEDMAKELGYKYFGMFDDDITCFRHRYIDGNSIRSTKVFDMDSVIDVCLDFMDSTNVACAGFGTPNNYIGGKYDPSRPVVRICFNALIRNATYTVVWRSNICHDRITALDCNLYGQVWIQLLPVQVDLAQMYGKNDGGNSDVYRNVDEFKRMFFATMMHPDCMSLADVNGKLNHKLASKFLCPMIVSSKYKRISC